MNPQAIDLAEYAAQGYPGLKRGMVITVHRPWRARWLLRPSKAFWAWVAWRIRHFSTLIRRQADPQAAPATEHHAMLYAGGGWCWSQDYIWRLVHLSNYRGSRLTFWDGGWDLCARNSLMAECAPRRGSRYGIRDIAGLAMYAITGREAWLEALADPRWICSEAVCEMVRAWAQMDYGAPGRCTKAPQQIADWMEAKGWKKTALWIA